jgi:hypothetical protein
MLDKELADNARKHKDRKRGLLKTIHVASINLGLIFAYMGRPKELMGVGFVAKTF